MKTNEAPEKLYLDTTDNPNNVWLRAFRPPFNKPPFNTGIEYTRTDVLIDRACEWLRKNTYEGTCEQILSKKPYPFMSDFINEFKKAMKGE